MAQKPLYKITIDPEYSDGEDLGIEKIAFTSKPAIITKGIALSAQDRPKEMFFADKLKYQIAAPIMIPMEIYRNDEMGEYFVEFTEKEIEKIHKKKMSKLNSTKGLFNLEHDNGQTVPAYLLECWIVDKPELDKSFSTYGVKVPKGTLFGVAQITDKEYYASLVENEQTGFSIEGFLGLSLEELSNKFNKHEKMEENTILPEGAKFQIEDKWYEVKDGKVVEVIESEKEVAASEEATAEEDKKEEVEMAEAPTEEDKKEEVEMAELPVEEAVVEEAPVAETYTKEEVDAKLDEIYKMIAELKQEEIVDEVDEIPVAMSVHERFAAFNRFARKK